MTTSFAARFDINTKLNRELQAPPRKRKIVASVPVFTDSGITRAEWGAMPKIYPSE